MDILRKNSCVSYDSLLAKIEKVWDWARGEGDFFV
jgi:hypothetical protein